MTRSDSLKQPFTACPQASWADDEEAVTDYERRKAQGTLAPGIPHAEVRRILGLRP
ncbi:hypothetical protein [Streptomyces bobili]|uniref:hypothetical protein n=1 Tax=Streptomyces bobili TaxID=67280 RepID=UPI0037B85B73